MEYLSQRGVPFVERNTGTDPTALQELLDLGMRSTPVVVIGPHRIVGFNRAKIDEALAART